MELEREKKTANGLGIASIAFGIVGILTMCGCGIGFVFGLIGVILGILGLVVLKKSEKITSIAGLIISGIALVFGCFWLFLYLPNHKNKDILSDYTTSLTESANTDSGNASNNTSDIGSSNSSSTNSNTNNNTQSTSSTDKLSSELDKSLDEMESNLNETWSDIFNNNSDTENEEKETKDPLADVKKVGINEEFGNDTITGKVIDVDYDYKNYNDLWTTVSEDKKCIYIKIKVTNISKESNYVSVGDFDCYVDDVAVDAELVNGMGDEPYNENIEPGRAAILGALYVVPKNASSIELEYNPIGEYADRVIIKIL